MTASFCLQAIHLQGYPRGGMHEDFLHFEGWKIFCHRYPLPFSHEWILELLLWIIKLWPHVQFTLSISFTVVYTPKWFCWCLLWQLTTCFLGWLQYLYQICTVLLFSVYPYLFSGFIYPSSIDCVCVCNTLIHTCKHIGECVCRYRLCIWVCVFIVKVHVCAYTCGGLWQSQILFITFAYVLFCLRQWLSLIILELAK